MANPILQSNFKAIDPPKEKTLPEYYLAKAKKYADEGREYWLVDGLTEEKRYFKKFDEESKRIASAFCKLGLQKDDVLIYMVKDLCKIHIMFTGVWRANGVMRASYPDDDYATILYRVRELNVKFIVCEEEAISMCKVVSKSVDWDVHILTINHNSAGFHSIEEFLEEDDGSDCPELLVTENCPAVILCTSGTTGLPKGAVHTHKSLLHQMRHFERIPWTLDKPNLIATKATHISGTSLGFILLSCGKTAVVVSNLTQNCIFNVAAKFKPGLVFAFPTFLVAMSSPEAQGYDFSSIEIIFSGGTPITPAIRQTFFKLPNVKDVISAYGLTEMMTCTSSCILKEDHERETPSMRDLPDFSVGKPYPEVVLQIRDPDSLEVLGPHQKGEICVQGPGLFKCYLLNQEATDKAYVDGFFRTGDLGYFDNEGFVYVVDRLKEIFKYYNDHISPTELENVIGKHPKVREVCVIGVADAGGHVPRAFVTLHNDSDDRAGVAEDIKNFANSNLAPYKHLRGGVYVVEELPKGKSGKITRLLVEKLPLPY